MGAIISTEHFGSELILGVVVVCIIVGPMLANRLRLPAMLGLVIMGTIAGPYVLDIVTDTQLLGLGNIGLLYLMFQAGLELDLRTFLKNRNAALVFGLLTFTLPLVLGWQAGVYVGLSGAAAILMGSIWASHTLVTLPEAKAAGIAANRAVATTAGATVITDTLALMILAVVSATSRGGDAGTVLFGLVLGLCLLVFYSFVVLPFLGRRFFMGAGQTRTNRFAFLLFGLTSAAMVGAAFGIEGLVGAFLAGLGLNALVPNGGELMDRVEFFGAALLVPAFLVYVGTKLDPAAVLQLQTLEIAAAFFVALALGKGLAALIGGRALGYSTVEAGVMFGMSIPQAAATLAATLVGAEIGLFSGVIVNAVVVVVLASLLAGALLTRAFASRVPHPDVDEAVLGRRVVLAVREEAQATPLARIATQIAAPDAGLVEAVAISVGESSDLAEERRILGVVESAAAAAGADVTGSVRRSDSFVVEVRDVVIEKDASVLLLAWKKERFDDQIFGSELDAVGRQVDVPILAARLVETPPRRVVTLLDVRSRAGARLLDARLALETAGRIAMGYGVPHAVVISARTPAHALGLGEGRDARTVLTVNGDLTPESAGLLPGDLIVMTPARYRSGIGAKALASVEDVSLVVVAAPGRMRIGGTTMQSYSILGMEAPAT